ncbi:MAG: 30S ribosomal protein S1 [Candidatus Zophobacter franzmannii]|nr:30S ribosomal protein S1 [Candidatus Zophobacter franzmannii]
MDYTKEEIVTTEVPEEEVTIAEETAVEVPAEPKEEIVTEVPEEDVPVAEEAVVEVPAEPKEEIINEIPEDELAAAEEALRGQAEENVVEAPVEPKKELTEEETQHQAMMDMIDQSFPDYSAGQIVEGTVVSVNDKEVLVDIGGKSEGAIPITEFSYSGVPAFMDKIQVMVTRFGEGGIRLSKKKADFKINLVKVKEIFEAQERLQGILRRRVKGGMIVEILGLEAFLPGSQIALKPIPNLDQFIGKEATFYIIKLDEERRNIIVSKKKVLEEDLQARKHEIIDSIKVEAELEGEVKNITNYGAFIDLGGIDGLLHIQDMSWGRINHPSEMLNIGDKLKVKVIDFDKESGRVALGLKQLVPEPWENVDANYPEGKQVKGKVVNIVNYGAFVELEPGVEGLIHVSEMSWTKSIVNPHKYIKIGDTVNAIVLAIDKVNHKISLGMKQMHANPWLSIEERYPEGTPIERKVKNITEFGVFLELEDGIDGLVHISDISWTKRIYHPREIFKKGQLVKAVVLSVDRTLHRIALGIKQMSSDPWENLHTILPLNTEIIGKVSKLIPKGLLVDIPVNETAVEGFVPISHLAIPNLEKPEQFFKIDEELPLKVIELDMENRRLILSVKAYFFSRDLGLQEMYVQFHMDQHDQIMEHIKEERARKEERKRKSVKKEKDAEAAVKEEKVSQKVEVEAPKTEEPAVVEGVVEETPAEEPVVEEVVVEETPAEEPVAEEVVVEEAPVEELVVEEVVVEETPAEEPVVEEAPEEETKKTEE